MIHITDNAEKLSFWQLILLQSKVNGAPYHGEELPRNKWEWPKNTYLQRRLHYLQESEVFHLDTLNLSADERFELLYKKLLEEYHHN